MLFIIESIIYVLLGDDRREKCQTENDRMTELQINILHHEKY